MRRVIALLLLSCFANARTLRAEDPVAPVGFKRPAAAPLSNVPPGSCCPPATMPWAMPGAPTDPANPNPNFNPNATPNLNPNAPSPLENALNSPFAQAAEAGGLASVSFNENFDGDFGGIYYARSIVTGYTEQSRIVGYSTRIVGSTQQQVGTTTQDVVVGNQTVRVTVPVYSTVPVTTQDPITVTERVPRRQIVRLPLAGRYSGVQIVDNDNPRPVDRVYFGYNYYSDVGGTLNPGGIGGSDIQRQTAGFEKTLLNGDASIGMRLPFIQQYGPVGLGQQAVGDLSVLLKYAFINNRETGNVASVGLVLTAPTGGGEAILSDGTQAPHSFLYQPWAGFVRVFDRAYVQGISNLIIPSDGRDPTLWGNSLGVGYWVHRNPTDRFIQGVIPVAEIHVRTPLSDRDPNGPIYLMDQVNLTTGVHFRLPRATISGAVCVPMVGPRPWDIEAMTYVNYRF